MQTAEPRGAGPAASQSVTDIGYGGAELGQSGEDKVSSWALQNTCVNKREARSDSGRRGLCVTWGRQGDTLRTWNHLSAVEDQVSGWCLLRPHSSLPGDGGGHWLAVFQMMRGLFRWQSEAAALSRR